MLQAEKDFQMPNTPSTDSFTEVAGKPANGIAQSLGDPLKATAQAGLDYMQQAAAVASALPATGLQMGSDAWAMLLAGIASMASAVDWRQKQSVRTLKFGINPVEDTLPRDWVDVDPRDTVPVGPQGEHCMLVGQHDDLARWMNGIPG